MASITIRNLDQTTKVRLRLRAARHDRSMEEEARDILRTSLCEEPGPSCDLATAIRRRLAPLGGVELPALERDPIREPPAFDA
jgi:plasmid stability protein